MARKTNTEERLDDSNLEKVIALLEPAEGTKAITKKLACEMLNIAYNTTRLGTLIEKYKEKKILVAKKRAEKRGKAATQDEVVYAIQEYLDGEPVSAISEALYRSAAFVNQILEENNVPRRAAAYNYFEPSLIPDGAARDRFSVGEIVYSARYDSTARIESEQLHKSGQWVYRIWLLSERWKQFAYTEACELASLDHLKKLGVKI